MIWPEDVLTRDKFISLLLFYHASCEKTQRLEVEFDGRSWIVGDRWKIIDNCFITSTYIVCSYWRACPYLYNQSSSIVKVSKCLMRFILLSFENIDPNDLLFHSRRCVMTINQNRCSSFQINYLIVNLVSLEQEQVCLCIYEYNVRDDL